jgi:hypothetical protein
MRRRLASCAAAVVACGLSGCSLLFGIRDNEGPLTDDGAAEVAADDTAVRDVMMEAGAGEAEAAVDASPPADAGPDTPARTDWCVLDGGGAGHLFCDDFDLHPPVLPPEVTPITSGPMTKVASDTAWATSGVNSLFTSAGPGGITAEAMHAENSSKRKATLEFDMRVDADDSTTEDQLFSIEFDASCSSGDTTYTVFLGASGTTTYFNEYGNKSGSFSGFVPGPALALVTAQHVKLSVDLGAKTASVGIGGQQKVRGVTPDCTPTVARLYIGLLYRSQASAGVIVRADNVVFDLE